MKDKKSASIEHRVYQVIDAFTDVEFKLILMDGSMVVTPEGYSFVSTLDRALDDDHLSTEIVETEVGGYVDYLDANNVLPFPRLSLISLCHRYDINVEDVLSGVNNYVIFMKLSEDTVKKLRLKSRELQVHNARLAEELENNNKRRKKRRDNEAD